MTVEFETREQELRARAIAQLEKKREFYGHALVFLVVNGLLILTWALTGAGFFWPMFPLAGWGIGLFFHGLDVYGGEPSEDRIRTEMDRLR
ncbi:2TM domain-containing protein [Egicoccus sp. AB-alg2]|uniref:2TM domain-containing protein n=1 Tax=Egicoccus sp. AB-alg2 TaxID=3242693 RepID=UPI00359CC2FF